MSSLRSMRPSWRLRRSVLLASPIAIPMLCTHGVRADFSPNLLLSVDAGGGSATFDPADHGDAWMNGNGTYSLAGSRSDGGHTLGWSMLVNPESFVVAGYVVTNTTLVAQTFSVMVTLPLGTAYGPSLLIGGSISGAVTDLNGDGAMLTIPGDQALYTALADGEVVDTLLDDPFTLSVGSFDSAAIGPVGFGQPIPSLPFDGSIQQSISVGLTFTLSAGDSASFTGIFVVAAPIPSAGVVPCLLVAALTGGRRRR